MPRQQSKGDSAASEHAIEDLKPAQPDSLAGRTFLGASAAAIVGSLAKFTGKSTKSGSTGAEPAAEKDIQDRGRR